jgi:hypothetical protein
MSSSKKRRELDEDHLKRSRQARQRKRVHSAAMTELNIQREIDYITGLAKAGDTRLVALGEFVLFSTQTRDAWLLDRTDNFAACICRDGESQPLTLLDSPTQFAIDWPMLFEIEGPSFIVYERSGRSIEISGYPTADIAAACRG